MSADALKMFVGSSLSSTSGTTPAFPSGQVLEALLGDSLVAKGEATAALAHRAAFAGTAEPPALKRFREDGTDVSVLAVDVAPTLRDLLAPEDERGQLTKQQKRGAGP